MRYLNNSELVSASTDSTLRMWDTKACTAARTFSGHNNEKNFVGLSVDADFIACGSESNEVSLPFPGSVASYTPCHAAAGCLDSVHKSAHAYQPVTVVPAELGTHSTVV